MARIVSPLVSICIPHWQVRKMMTICLRAIRKYTRDIPIEVIVVDNNSKDDSLDYLRSLSWIRLIERGEQTPQDYLWAVPSAYDLGFQHHRGNYFAVMHVDTIIKHPGWLERLLQSLEADENCAVTGAWKLEPVRPVYEFVKKVTDTKRAKLWLRRTILRDSSARRFKREICPRDYCALYRSEPIRRHGLVFVGNEQYRRCSGGERMYFQLRDHGYGACVIGTSEMMQYMEHLAHGTAGMQPEQRRLNHWRAQKKIEKKVRRYFNMPLVKELAADSSLDE